MVRSYWYIQFFKQVFQNSPTYGGWKASGGDTFKIALCPPSFRPNQDTHTSYNDVVQVSGQGYTLGGQVLVNKTISTSSGALVLTADPVSWEGCVFTTRYAVIYDDTNTGSLSKQLVRFIDFGEDLQLAGHTIELTFDNGGTVTIVVTPPEPVAPALVTSNGVHVSNVNGATVNLIFDQQLDSLSVPATGTFAVLVDAVSRSVTAVAVSSTNVILTLASAVTESETVTVAYTAPGSNPIRNLQQVSAESFAAITLDNQTVDTPPADVTAPTLTSATINGTGLILQYNEQLNTGSVPATSAFTVQTDGNTRSLSSVSINNGQVLITLASPVLAANIVTATYAAGGSPIEDLAGNNAANFSGQAVTNLTPGDTSPPILTALNVNAASLTIQYNELLDTTSTPATSAYSITVNGVTRTVNSVSISNQTVTLTLASAVAYAETVIASYSQPTSNRLRDLGQNNAASFFNQPVQNQTSPPPPPTEPVAPTLNTVTSPDSGSIVWNHTNVTDETGYDYESGPSSSGPWTLRGTRPANTVTFTWSGATASTTYHMRVSSIGPSGTRYPSNVLNVTTGAPPEPPVPDEPTAPVLNSVSASAPTVITWNHTNVSNELGYEYETAAASSGPWTTRGTGPANSTTFTWSSATAATLYYMRVRSFGAAGTRYSSNVLSLTTPTTNAASFVSQSIPSLTMTTGSTQTITVVMRNDGTATWTAAAGYELYSQDPFPGTVRWGTWHVLVSGSVLPNSNATFTFGITAPTTAGSYGMQWRMRQDSTEFGSLTQSVTITVTNPTPPPTGRIVSRFFSTLNTWYQLIPANPTITANSANIVARVAAEATLTCALSEWSVPIYYATTSTPTYTVTVGTTDLSRDVILSNGWNLNVPIPPGALPSGAASMQAGQYRDGHAIIISADRRYAWDFFIFRPWNSPPFANRVKRWDLLTDGVLHPQVVANGGNCRAGGTPLLHGIVTWEEIQRGYIDHALAFVYGGGARQGTYGVYPCQRSSTDAIGTSPTNDGNDPWDPLGGMRFQLNPSIDVNTLSTNAAVRTIARALQQYGMIFVENNGPGNNGFAIEELTYDTSGRSWSGILTSTSTTVIPLASLRVVDPLLPPFT